MPIPQPLPAAPLGVSVDARSRSRYRHTQTRGHLDGSRSRPLASLAIAVLMATVALLGVPASSSAQGQVRSPEPTPMSAVQAGTITVDADVQGASDVQVAVDGAVLGPLNEGGTPVDLVPGAHQIAIQDGGTTLREWTVYAAGVQVSEAPGDLVALGQAASGPSQGRRPVLLVNPDQASLAAAAGPLAVATRSVLLPTGGTSVPQATMNAIAQTRAPGDEVLVLGGLDAVGNEVLDQLSATGYQPQRIGSGSASDVAVAAADFSRVALVYTRGGGPTLRPVLLAPAEPLATALQAAALAARSGASLVLADGDTLSQATLRVIGERDRVILSQTLSDAAADSARAAAAPDAQVSTVPALPDPTKQVWIADVDVDPAFALFATRAAGAGVAVVTQVDDARDWVATNNPAGATLATSTVTARDVAGWWVDGPSAPLVDVTVDQASGTELSLQANRPVEGAVVYVTLYGIEWQGQTAITGDTVTWTPGPRPDLPPDLEPAEATAAPLALSAVVAAEGHLRHVALETAVTILPQSSVSPEGFLVAGGTSQVVGSGPLRTFTIEVEPGTGLDLAAVTQQAQSILLDPTRGWTARGARSLQRVDSPAAANIRVVVALPGTVDRNCGRVGLSTGGRLSCWDGRRAMLNLNRWNTGVSPFHTDLEVYRTYLVSHEFGHGLGFGHTSCPQSGALAPVMNQQSKGLGGCVANGWPYPNG